MKSNTTPTIQRLDYQPASVSISRISMRFDIQNDFVDVHTQMQYQLADGETALLLNGEALEIKSLAIDNKPLIESEYHFEDNLLRIVSVPEKGSFHSVVRIYPDKNKALDGLYRSGGMLTTQCEAEGFRRITFYADRPDVLGLFDVRIEASLSEYPVLLSNGNCIDKGRLSDTRHYAHWQDPIPKPAYLFALVAGTLAVKEDKFVTMSGKSVQLAIYTEPHNKDKTDFAMTCLRNAMRWDETRFGLEYDLDIFMIVAVDHFNMGAMENKGLNIFNSQCVLANPETATDAEYRQIESIIGHEYFHNWTGNRVTCRSWFELSLKEGLTVFRDQEFSADMGANDIQRIEGVSQLWGTQFPEDSGPMAHPVRPAAYQEINNFYTPTVYEKGAEVVRLLHTRLSEQGFQKGMKLYFDRHDGQAVTCDDFVAAMADANQVDLSEYLKWYSQSGTPVLSISTAYTSNSETLTISLQQETPKTADQSEKRALPIPVNIALFANNGQRLDFELLGKRLTETQLMLSGESQTWTLQAVKERPVLSALRGFTAPVKVNFEQTISELCLLMAHETDAFSRWAASQKLFESAILSGHESAGQITLSPEFIAAVTTLLKTAEQTPELVAKLLDIPGYAVLINQLESVNIDHLVMARESVIQQLGRALSDEFSEVYQKMVALDDGSYQSAPARALKNTCLRYWAQQSSEAFSLAHSQATTATNMTDEMAGVVTMINSCALDSSAEKKVALKEVLAIFYQRWSEDSQVLDKWFSLCGLSLDVVDGLAGFEELYQHPDFTLQNPNRVRALVGSYSRNVSLFHQADGSGYRKLAEIILELDTLNPQIAAGLCRIFSIWGKLDSSRKTIIQEVLENMKKNSKSPNVLEWVDKLLNV
jgi:aminopeptidase N